MPKEDRTINLTYVTDENNEIDISMETEGFSGGLDEVLEYLHIAIRTALLSDETEEGT